MGALGGSVGLVGVYVVHVLVSRFGARDGVDSPRRVYSRTLRVFSGSKP